ncbi:DoxX family protein [Rhizomonospora bruguierae]|uniref:DoxX family protein n=1 Tax=Rhizomonospora bruguierae TaxID=1581705 RepID=UPI001BCFDBBB|nr:DoxX family protein [Micromonospora sp. NBRC 107566]
MNILLWVLQGALAAVFLWSGANKISLSRERLIASGQTGIAVYPMPVVRFAAACELLAAAGLVLPWATGVGRVLTPLAALGLCAVMVGAAAAHVRLREPWSVAANAVIFAVALAVAVARLAELG